MTGWSGRLFGSRHSFAQLRISHKLTRPHDRPPLSQRCSAGAHGEKIDARHRGEAGGIETWRACAEFIVYFWMPGIMSSCEKKKMSGAVSSAFTAPGEGPGINDRVLERPKLSRENQRGYHPLKQAPLELKKQRQNFRCTWTGTRN